MRKHALKPGLILATASILITLIFHFAGIITENWAQWVGLPIVIFILIYFSNKVRKNAFSDKWTFGQAFKFNFLTQVYSTIILFGFHIIFYAYINNSVMDKAHKNAIEDMGNASDEQIEASLGLNSWMHSYLIPLPFQFGAY